MSDIVYGSMWFLIEFLSHVAKPALRFTGVLSRNPKRFRSPYPPQSSSPGLSFIHPTLFPILHLPDTANTFQSSSSQCRPHGTLCILFNNLPMS